MYEKESLIPSEHIDNLILQIRNQNVIIDADLAKIYGVTTKKLNQAVKRNSKRFPADFMFQLNQKEKSEVVTICDHLSNLKYSPYLPYVFTEHGAVMMASVLNSERAIIVSVYVARAFIRLRKMISSNKEMVFKLNKIEQKVETHDKAIAHLINTIRKLMTPQKIPRKKIGFQIESKKVDKKRNDLLL